MIVSGERAPAGDGERRRAFPDRSADANAAADAGSTDHVVRVKVCGMRRPEDAALAVRLGAHALGFVFWPQSPRAVDADDVRAITRRVPPFVELVGVFVNQPPHDVHTIASRAGLTAIQLHGDEDPVHYVSAGLRLIKAVAADGRFARNGVPALDPDVTILLDAHDPVRRGGTGRTIDWTAAAVAARTRPVILSGGLTPENVRRGIDVVGPYAVDVSSGIELSPGVKDAVRMRAFFAAVRSAVKRGGHNDAW